jgi:hypothetical protein
MCASTSLSLCVDCVSECQEISSICSSEPVYHISPCSPVVADSSCPSATGYSNLVAVKYSLFDPPPIVSGIILVASSSTSLSLMVEMDHSSGTVFCRAYLFPNQPSTTSEIVSGGKEGLLNSTSSTATVTLDGLRSLTKYNLFCATTSVHGTQLAFADVLSSSQTATTACCKTFLISTPLASTVFAEGSILTNLLSFSAESPSSSLVVDFTATHTSPTGVITDLSSSWYPSASRTVTSALSSEDFSLNTIALAGSYTLTVSLSGPAMSEFVKVIEGPLTFEVTSLTVEPPLPVPSGARFNRDASIISLTFSSATNMGKRPAGIFPCQSLFSFANGAVAQCQWITKNNCTIFTPGPQYPTIGGTVTVLANKIQASCPTDSCSTWRYIPRTPVLVLPPSEPIRPTIEIGIPSSVGVCEDLIIDLTRCSGSANRDWTTNLLSIQIVTGVSNPTSPLNRTQAFISSAIAAGQSRIVIPNSYLTAGASYRLTLTLCNFLGGCATASKSTSVLSVSLPSVAIAGAQSRLILRSATLLLTGSATSYHCNTASSVTDLLYTWKVLDEQSKPVSNLVSTSKISSTFLLPPYSLKANTVYTILMTAYDSIVATSATASVTVSVGFGPIVAVIAGASERVIPFGSSIILDASNSYDANLPLTIPSAFKNVWTCRQVSPTLSSTCPLSLTSQGRTGVTNSVKTLSTSAGKTAEITLTATSTDGRTSSTSLRLVVGDPSTPVITFASVLRGVKINPNSKFSLLASVTASTSCLMTWAVTQDMTNTPLSVSDIALNPASRSLIVPALNSSAVFQANLIIRAGSLLPGLTYSFDLSCVPYGLTSAAASSSILLTTNAPPKSGKFSVSPSSGEELLTVFLLQALEWIDDDLPISYQYQYRSLEGRPLVLQLRSERTSSSSSLPAGDVKNLYAVTTSLIIYDSLNANLTTTATVRVNPRILQNSQTKQDSLLSLLNASESPSVGTLSLVTGVLNAVDCSTAPNCSLIKRADCATKPNTCGSCLSGFVGEEGDSNSLCVNTTTFSDSPGTLSSFKTSSWLAVSEDSTCSLDCGLWKHCETQFDQTQKLFKQQCVKDSKQCADPVCSGHGACEFRSWNQKKALSCPIDSSSCSAVCICKWGYAGTVCSETTEEFEKRMIVREQAILSMSETLSTLDTDSETLTSFVYGIASLCQQPNELTSNSLSSIESLTSTLIDLSSTVPLSSTVLQAFMIPLTTLLSRYDEPQDHEYVMSLIDRVCALVASDLTIGENSVGILYPFIRASVLSADSFGLEDLSVAMPMTNFEALLSESNNVVTLVSTSTSFPDDTIRGWLISYDSSSVYAIDGRVPFTSNLVRTKFLAVQSENVSVRLEIKNREYQVFNNASRSDHWRYTVKTTCDKEDKGYFSATCPGTLVNVTVYCNNSAGVFQTICPRRKLSVRSDCVAWNGTSFVSDICSLESYDGSSSTCNCLLSNTLFDTTVPTRRVLSSTGIDLQIGTKLVSDYTVGAVGVTDFTSHEGADEVMGMTLKYAATTVCGLVVLAIILGYFIEYQLEEMSVSPQIGVDGDHESKPIVVVAQGIENEEIAEVIVSKSAPISFVASTVWQFSLEILQFHKWLHIFYLLISPFVPTLAYYHNFLQDSILLACDIVTMFLMQALVCLIFDPLHVDNESCERYSRQDDCQQNYILPYLFGDRIGERCVWNEDTANCEIRDAQSSLWTLVLSACVAAVLSIPFTRLTRLLFLEYIFVPTLKNPSTGLNWLLHFLPASWIFWIVKYRIDNPDRYLSRSWFNHLNISIEYEYILTSSEKDVKMLKKRLLDHVEPLSGPEKDKFMQAWCMTSDSIPIGSLWQRMKAMLWKTPTMDEILLQQFRRAHTMLAMEHGSVRDKLRASNYPLDEFHVIRLLFQDLMTDRENVVIDYKSHRNQRRLGSHIPKYWGVKLVALLGLLLYLWVAVVFTSYFASTRVEPLQKLWLYSVLCWGLLDMFCIRPLVILLCDVAIPSLVRRKLTAIHNVFVKCIVNLKTAEMPPGYFKYGLMLYGAPRICRKYFSTKLQNLMVAICPNVPRRSPTISSYPLASLQSKFGINDRLSNSDESWALWLAAILLSEPLAGEIFIELIVALFWSATALAQTFYYLRYGPISLLPICLLVALVLLCLWFWNLTWVKNFRNRPRVQPQSRESSQNERAVVPSDDEDDHSSLSNSGSGELPSDDSSAIFGSDPGDIMVSQMIPEPSPKVLSVATETQERGLSLRQQAKSTRVTEVFNWIDNVMGDSVDSRSSSKRHRRPIKMKSSPRALGSDEKRMMYRSRLGGSLGSPQRKNPITGSSDVRVTPKRHSIKSTIAMIDDILSLKPPKKSFEPVVAWDSSQSPSPHTLDEKPLGSDARSNRGRERERDMSISWDYFGSPNNISDDSIDSSDLFDMSSVAASPRAHSPAEESSSQGHESDFMRRLTSLDSTITELDEKPSVPPIATKARNRIPGAAHPFQGDQPEAIRQTGVNGTIVASYSYELETAADSKPTTPPRKHSSSYRTSSVKRRQLANIIRGLDKLDPDSSASDEDEDDGHWQVQVGEHK